MQELATRGQRGSAVALNAQPNKFSFLDLPAEIRNDIYKLIQWPPNDGSRPTGIIRSDGEGEIPAIAQTCSQIRAEYLSQALPKATVALWSRTTATYRIHHLDEAFRKSVRRLFVATVVPIYPVKSLPEAHDRACPPEALRDASRRADFYALDMGGTNSQMIAQFSFVIPCLGQAFVLSRTSKELIKSVLSTFYSGKCSTADGAKLVAAVDRIQRLRLDYTINTGYSEERRPPAVEFCCVILDSPRRLAVVEWPSSRGPAINIYRNLLRPEGIIRWGVVELL